MDVKTLELVATRGGTRLRIRVQPGARREAIAGVHGGALKVSVTAPPERGKANRAALEVLAAALEVPGRSLELVSGHASRDKVVLVPLSPEVTSGRLERVQS